MNPKQPMGDQRGGGVGWGWGVRGVMLVREPTILPGGFLQPTAPLYLTEVLYVHIDTEKRLKKKE